MSGQHFQYNLFNKKASKRLLYIFVPFLLLLFISCAHHTQEIKDIDLYNKALNLVDKKKYRRAVEIFERLKSEYPASPLISKARIKTADCLYNIKDFELARSEYEDFLRFFPLHPDTDYARFRVASTFFDQILSADRDQSFTVKSLENFERFLKEYPQSDHTGEAKEKILRCRLRLVEHDIYITRFYLNTNSGRAARNRIKRIWTFFPDIDKKEALYQMLYESYYNDQMFDEASLIFSKYCE